MVSPTAIVLWLMVAGLVVVAFRRPEKKHRLGLRVGVNIIAANTPRIIMALLIAGFASQILPKELVAEWIGGESGIRGILIASLLGGFIPGGGIISFPVAVVLYKAGADIPQLVAFLTSWSVLGIHRVFLFEAPMLGARFAAMRLSASVLLPPLSGVIAAVLVMLVQNRPLPL
jgi:uncharacterized membrane protein YraQ (UPF0718 family)